jgi:hypothetical protein
MSSHSAARQRVSCETVVRWWPRRSLAPRGRTARPVLNMRRKFLAYLPAGDMLLDGGLVDAGNVGEEFGDQRLANAFAAGNVSSHFWEIGLCRRFAINPHQHRFRNIPPPICSIEAESFASNGGAVNWQKRKLCLVNAGCVKFGSRHTTGVSRALARPGVGL